MQIEREIGRQCRPVEYLRDQVAVSRPEQHGVMGKLWMLSLEAEVDHEQRHRVAFLRQLSAMGPAARMSSQEYGVGVNNVGVAGHAVERENFAVREPDAGRLVSRCL